MRYLSLWLSLGLLLWLLPAFHSPEKLPDLVVEKTGEYPDGIDYLDSVLTVSHQTHISTDTVHLYYYTVEQDSFYLSAYNSLGESLETALARHLSDSIAGHYHKSLRNQFMNGNAKVTISKLGNWINEELFDNSEVQHSTYPKGKPFARTVSVRYSYTVTLPCSRVEVTIKNQGKAASPAAEVKVADSDISIEQVRMLELGQLAADVTESNQNEEDDPNLEQTISIPALKPGQSVKVRVYLPGPWIFNPNCEMEVIVDPNERIKESNEKNNRKFLFHWG